MPRILRRALSPLLTEAEISHLQGAFDSVGDIAILRVPGEIYTKKKIIAEALLREVKHIKVVLLQSGPVSGDFRTRELEHLAGEERTTTIHREYGCTFLVDLSRVYFSPRLSTERIRIARLVRPGERILNMFAGIGSFSIIIAKHQPLAKIVNIELNPVAHRLAMQNARLNKVADRIEHIVGDAREVLLDHPREFDRVLMPLPEKSIEFIDSAASSIRKDGSWLHFYSHVRSDSPKDAISTARKLLDGKLSGLGLSENARVVKEVGPGWFQVVVDALIKKMP